MIVINTQNILKKITDSKDEYLLRHQSGVTLYAGLIATILCPELLSIVRTSASLHDIGKVEIPDTILFKTCELNKKELQIMKKHPVIGSGIIEHEKMRLAGEIEIPEIIKAVKHHHEKWNGRGYPYGLLKEDIPLASRIIAVADTFDAMTTDRPYRKAVEPQEALSEIINQSNEQFDPYVVEAFQLVFNGLAGGSIIQMSQSA